MTLRNLRIFVTVADCGSMSEAAKRMSIAQPSVSGAIAEIEDTYNVRLFERLGRRLYITPIGRQLEGYASHILSMYDLMEHKLRNAQESVALRVGATVTVGTCVIGDIFKRFEKLCPDNQPELVVHNTQVIEKMLTKSELDIAVVEGEIRSNDLVTKLLVSDTMILIAAPDCPLTRQKRVTLHDLEEYPFILREEGSGTRAVFERCMSKIRIQWVCNNSEAIIRGVESGFGLTVISKRLVKRQLQDGTVIEIPVVDSQFGRDFHLVWHKNKFQSQPIQWFIQACEEFAKADQK